MRSLFKIPSIGLLSLTLLTMGAKADSVTIQYFLGGVEGTPENCIGVLVADANADGFNSVFQPGIVGDQLAVGETLAGSDDVVIGLTESTGDDFDGAEVGFADTFSLINYGDLGIAEGTPVRFFWFPTQDASSAGALAADVGFLSYTDNAPDTGGDMAYVLPPAPGVYTLSHLTTPNSGSLASLVTGSGSLGPIETQPVGGTFEADESVSLAVATKGNSGFDFQWYEGSQGDETKPVGTNSSNLVLGTVAYNSDYWVRVSDQSGYVDSQVANVQVVGGGVRPDFTWDTVDGAERYQLLIRRNGKTWKVFWVYGQDTTTWTPDSNLTAGVYTWFVRSWSANSGTGGWVSSTFSIGIPELLAPEGAVPDQESRPELSWTRSVGATRYQLLLKRNGAKWKVQWIEGEDTLTWRSDVDMPIGNYKFWIRPYSPEGGIGPWAIPMEFSIGMPELLAPEGLLVDGAAFPEFTWNGSNKLELYNIFIKRNGVRWEYLWLDPSTSWTPDYEFGSGEYQWFMRGWTSANGRTPWAESKTFTIEEGAQPISPLGLTNAGVRPLFEWEPEPAATWYLLDFRTAANKRIFRGWVRDATSWIPEADLSDGHYIWFIRPYGPKIGHSHWRGPFAFELDNSAGDGIETMSMQGSGPRISPSDLNSDGMGDLLVQDLTTGHVKLQLLQGDSLIGDVSLSIQPGDPNWKVVGQGDHDGDQDSDILWQNSSSDEIVIWHLEATGSVSGVVSVDVSSFVNPVKALALADFDGNGLGDLLVKDTVSGDVSIAVLDGGSVTSQIALSATRSADWEFAAVADLNDDSTQDLIWQNKNTGQVEFSYIDGQSAGTTLSKFYLAGVSTAGKSIVTAFDINGDEQIDLILQDDATGLLSSAIVDGGAVSEISNLSYQLPSIEWEVVNFGDVNR